MQLEIISSSLLLAGQREQTTVTQLMDGQHSDGRGLTGHNNPLIHLRKLREDGSFQAAPEYLAVSPPQNLHQRQTWQLPSGHCHRTGQDVAEVTKGKARS